MRVLKILTYVFLLVFSQNLLAIEIDSFSNIHLDTLNNEGLNDLIKQAWNAKDHCMLSRLYYKRATLNSDFTNDGEFILEDLDFSGSYAQSYCKDTTFYHTVRLKYAEVLQANNKNKEFAIQEAKESLNYFEKHNLQSDMLHSLHVLALLYEQSSEFKKAEEYIGNAIDLAVEMNDTISLIRNRNIANRFITIMAAPGVEVAVAVSSSKEDFITSCNLNLESDAIDIGLTLAETYVKMNNIDDAISQINYLETLNISKLSQEKSLHEIAIKANRKAGNLSTALSYSDRYSEIIEAMHDQEEQAKIANSVQKEENKQLTEKLNSETERSKDLEKKNKERLQLAILLGVAILASLLAIYYIIRFYNQKIRVNELISNQREEINKQRIVKLENNMKIQSLSSMVSGQEAERNRIANDLHDSLGGTLSALKLQFENVVMENHADDVPFNNISKLIDGACSEVREIARNLKPASLENIGLEAAVRDLINKYNINTDIDMSFHTYVGDLNLDYNIKLNMYRIIQELLNNVMKHAEATEVDVQLTMANNELIIKVEDDGKGFNINWVKKGLGLDSIQSRVNVLKGDLNIDTAPTRGTSVIIHIPTHEVNVA